MKRDLSPAPVRKSVVVATGLAQAFALFTTGMGQWWPKSHSLNSKTTRSDVIIEPKVNGRWYERGADGTECQWGHVIAWEPPNRVVLAWQLNADWTFDPQLVTELEIRFSSQGKSATKVDLEHRLLERFGERATEVKTSLDSEGGWAGLLAAYADAA